VPRGPRRSSRSPSSASSRADIASGGPRGSSGGVAAAIRPSARRHASGHGPALFAGLRTAAKPCTAEYSQTSRYSCTQVMHSHDKSCLWHGRAVMLDVISITPGDGLISMCSTQLIGKARCDDLKVITGQSYRMVTAAGQRKAGQHLDSIHGVGLEVGQRVITAPVVGISRADTLSSGRKDREQRSKVMHLAAQWQW